MLKVSRILRQNAVTKLVGSKVTASSQVQAAETTNTAPEINPLEYLKPKKFIPQVYFPRHTVTLLLHHALNPSKEFTFVVPVTMTKPEIKKYLESYYGITGIERITTRIKKGIMKRDPKNPRKFKQSDDEKKATIFLKETVDLKIPQDLKEEIVARINRKVGGAALEERERREMAEQYLQEQEKLKGAALTPTTTEGAPAPATTEQGATEAPAAEATPAAEETVQQPAESEQAERRGKKKSKYASENMFDYSTHQGGKFSRK